MKAKKALVILLTLAMLSGFVPQMALAAEAPIEINVSDVATGTYTGYTCEAITVNTLTEYVVTITDSGDYELTGTSTQVSKTISAHSVHIVVTAPTANITLSNASITIVNFSPLSIAPGSTVNLTLAAGTENTLSLGGSEVGFAGVYVPAGASIVIGGTGKLNASGGGGGAGYGAGAGIGGESWTGKDSKGVSLDGVNWYGIANAGNITINSGVITATRNVEDAAAIGGGIGGSGSSVDGSNKIIINGGTVTVTGSIGGGGGSTSLISTIRGGSVKSNELWYTNGTCNVHPTVVTALNSSGSALSNTNISCTLPSGVTFDAVADSAGKLYLWLPEGNNIVVTLKSGGVNYKATGNIASVSTSTSPNAMTATPIAVTSVTVSPATASVEKGKTVAFSATVIGTNDPSTEVTWSVTGGVVGTSIDSSTGVLSVATNETASTLTVTAISKVDSNKSGSATVTVTEHTYALTINAGSGGSITTGSSGNYTAGTVINIAAAASANYSFNKWTTSSGGTFGNASSASTTFTMPAEAVTITASFLSNEITPSASINYINETLTGLTANASYKINSNPYTAMSGTIAIDDTWFGTDILIVKTGNGTTTHDSATQSLAIPSRPNKPSTPMFSSKTKTAIAVTSVSGQEYSIDNGATWQDSGTFSGLAVNTSYSICTRIKTVSGLAFASDKSTGLTVTTNANSIPVRKAGMSATANASVSVNSAYTLNLTSIFADTDNDAMTYKVKIDTASPVTANTNYSYTPIAAGTTTLVFTANDGAADSTDTYTVTLTATSTGGGSTGGGSSGGGSTTSTPKVTSTVSGSGSNAVTTAGAEVSGNITGGKQTVPVPTDIMTGLTDAAKKAESSGGTAVASIDTGSGSGLTNVGVTLPGAQFSALASGTGAALQIKSGLGSVTFSSKAVDTIGSAGSGDVSFSIGAVDKQTLSADEQKLVGTRPIYSYSVTVGNTKVTEFGSSVTVSVPYTLGANEDPNAIVVYYIDATGKLTPMQGKYDTKTGAVTFTTTHFSEYMIGYNKVTFSDVPSTAWYSDAVTFIAARSIANGTGNGSFSPEAKLTRGEFLVMMMRAYNISADTNPTDNFSDAGNTYYTNYLAAAKRLGISTGVGNNMFAPYKEITRQEMFTLLYNSIKLIGQLPSEKNTKSLSEFSDVNDIASWAKDSMQALVKAGVITGSDGRLQPTDSSTRAQLAQVLYNLLAKQQ